jgi:molybdopterin/thiamine biosynthesis adenylyltransferase
MAAANWNGFSWVHPPTVRRRMGFVVVAGGLFDIFLAHLMPPRRRLVLLVDLDAVCVSNRLRQHLFRRRLVNTSVHDGHPRVDARARAFGGVCDVIVKKNGAR